MAEVMDNPIDSFRHHPIRMLFVGHFNANGEEWGLNLAVPLGTDAFACYGVVDGSIQVKLWMPSKIVNNRHEVA